MTTTKTNIDGQLAVYTDAVREWLDTAQTYYADDTLAIMVQIGAPVLLALEGTPTEKLNAFKMAVGHWKRKAAERDDSFATAITNTAASLPL